MTSYLPQTPRYLKVPLIILNVILWLLGLVLVIIGGVGVTFFSKFKEFTEAADATETLKNLSVSIPAGVLSIGIFFLILTITGCVVAYKEQMVGLVFYIVLMMVLLVVLIGIGGEALSYQRDTDNNTTEMEISDNWYHVSRSVKNHTITELESVLECCGWNSSMDQIDYSLCPKDTTTKNILYNGTYCQDVIETAVSENLSLVGAAGVAIGVIELVCMLFALFLIIRLYKVNKSFK